MSPPPPILPVTPVQGISAILPVPQLSAPPAVSFAQMLTNGIDKVNQSALNADKLVRAFTLDDSVPVHQVTFALDQARSSLELALQVRTRLLEGYQQLMNMQL
jgi:flagellar hook-basal body complex protein FliE